MRHLWLAAALLLLAFRLLTPAGFMPQWRTSGFGLELCDGVAAAAPAGHHGQSGHHGQPDHEDKTKGNPCPYAAATGSAALLFPQLAAFQSVAMHAQASPWPDTPAVARYRPHERPRSRAPPMTA